VDRDKILHGRTEISYLKILAPWAKGAQNGGEKVFLVTGTMNSHFFITEQIGNEIQEKKRPSVCSVEP